MAVPQLNHTTPHIIVDNTTVPLPATLLKRSCGKNTGYYTSPEYPVAVKFTEKCYQVSAFDGAFKNCTFTRAKTLNYPWQEVKSFGGENALTIYANATIPASALGCLNGTLPHTLQTSNAAESHMLFFLLIIPGMAALALLSLCCKHCLTGSSNRPQRRDAEAWPQGIPMEPRETNTRLSPEVHYG